MATPPHHNTAFPELPRRTRNAFRLQQRLRCGFWCKPPGRADVNTRCQADYSVIYILTGGGHYRDEETETTFGPGDVIQRFPNRPREIRYTIEDEVLHIAIGVPRSIYDTLVVGGVADATRAVFTAGLHDSIIARTEHILRELRELPDDRLYGTLAQMHQLLAELHKLGTHGPPRLRPEIEEACAILGHDFGRPMRLGELADRLNLSETTFRRLFTMQVGVPPGEYRLRRRTEYVQELLCDRELSITEVAAKAGYPELFALSRQFRQRTGLSPRRFRELYG